MGSVSFHPATPYSYKNSNHFASKPDRVSFGIYKQKKPENVIETVYDPEKAATHYNRKAWKSLGTAAFGLISTALGMSQFPQHLESIKTFGIIASTTAIFSSINNTLHFRWLQFNNLRQRKK